MNRRILRDLPDSVDQVSQRHTSAPLADAVVAIDRSGRVQTAPETSVFGDLSAWEGQEIAAILDRNDRDAVDDILSVKDGATLPRIVGVHLPNGRVCPITVSAMSGEDGDSIVLHLQDSRLMADLEVRLAQAQSTLKDETRSDRSVAARYRALLRHLNEPVVLIDSFSGRILDLSDTAAEILGSSESSLLGAAFTQCFEGRRRSEFLDALMALGMSDSCATVTMELRPDGRTINMSASLARSGPDTVVICTLHDDTSVAAPDRSKGLPDAVADGVVELSPDMVIRKANAAFMDLVGATAPVQLTGRPFSQFLARGAIDLRALTDPEDPGVLTTQVQDLVGQRTPVEISSASLVSGGHALVLRQTTLIELSRGTPGTQDSDGLQNIPDATRRVGTETLRDIVASMTDVLEKQCIEEALSLTRNNRVATAEMLGLSRQSLYVKLRRFGLLNSGEN